jgi:hypothetical protein
LPKPDLDRAEEMERPLPPPDETLKSNEKPLSFFLCGGFVFCTRQ